MVPILKKEKGVVVDDYQGVTLTQTAYKVFRRAIGGETSEGIGVKQVLEKD